MSEILNLLEKTDKEEKENKDKTETPKKPRKRKISVKSTVDPKLYEEMIKIQKEQTQLLRKIVSVLASRSIEGPRFDINTLEDIIEKKISSIKLPVTEYKHINDVMEVKVLIKKFIKGKMPHDKLPSGRNHRTFRIGNFIKRMQDEWQIVIERELVEIAKQEMENDGKILPTGAAGKNTRYVLKEFIGEYSSKITKKDRDILKWLNENSRFFNKDFTMNFYSKNNPVRPSDHDWRSANRKIKVLLRRKWIEIIPNSQPKEFLVNKEIVNDLFLKLA